MTELITASELQKCGVSAETLLLKFKEQLIKDFERSNLLDYLQPLNDLSFDGIQNNLSDALKKIPGSGLQQLYYTIDISEKQVREAMSENDEKESNDLISAIIIKRILQKVILKLVYSK